MSISLYFAGYLLTQVPPPRRSATAMGTVPAQSRTALQTARTRTHARTRAHTHAHRSRVSGLPRGCHPGGGSSQWAALPVAAWTPAVARESRASSHREHPGRTGCKVLAQPARTACTHSLQPASTAWMPTVAGRRHACEATVLAQHAAAQLAGGRRAPAQPDHRLRAPLSPRPRPRTAG